MPWGIAAAAVAAGGSVYAADKAAGAQERAGRNARAIEEGQRIQQRLDQAPYRQIGAGATQQLANLFGIGGVTGIDDRVVGSKVFKPSEVEALLKRGHSIDDILKLGRLQGDAKTSDMLYLMNTYNISSDDLGRLKSGTFTPLEGTEGGGGADFSSFYDSPGYRFQLDQGKRAIERSAAARGGLASGNTLAALTEFGQGLAGQRFDTHVNQLMGLSGIGQNATNTLTNADLVTSGRLADSEVNIGNARASGVVSRSNALNDLFGTVEGIAKEWRENRRKKNGTNPTDNRE